MRHQRAHGGLGLGLALVYYLVELHGGTVQTESLGKDRGATFTVELPIPPLPHVSAQDATPREHRPDSSSLEMRLEGLTLMVVELDAITREWLTMYLEEEGAEVIAVSSVSKALSLLNQRAIDGLIYAIGTDEQLESQLMIGLRQWQQDNHRLIPAIALLPVEWTWMQSTDQFTLPPVFQNSLCKPIDPDELITVVTESVSRSISLDR